MTKPIPYTQSGFDMLLKHSRVFHNNQEVNPSAMNYNITGTNANGATFIQSFIAELDLFIQSNLYDVNLKDKTRNYVSAQMNKWGKFFKPDMMSSISAIDMKYVSVFQGRGFLTDLFAPYICDNVMITE